MGDFVKTLFARVGAAGIVSALALFLVSCGAEEPTEAATPVESAAAEPTTESADDSDAAEPAESSFQEEELEGELVSSFPDDVPLYPGEIVSSVAALSDVSQSPEWNVMMETADAFDVVDAAIRSDYTSNGWSISNEMDYLDGYLLMVRNGDYIVSITYAELGEVGITINYGVSS